MAKNRHIYLMPMAVANHIVSLNYCNIIFFINEPVVIDGLRDEYACFRRGGSDKERFPARGQEKMLEGGRHWEPAPEHFWVH